MQISSNAQILELRECILRNAEVSKEKLMKCMESMDAVQLFAALKFEKQGVDPISGIELNLIEQIHQMYSDLVVLFATQELLENYPDKVFELHLGPEAGYDIQSLDGQVVAECFAATSVASNDKLNKDCTKLLQSDAEDKYLYFYAHCDSETMLQKRYIKYPEIQFRKIDKF